MLDTEGKRKIDNVSDGARGKYVSRMKSNSCELCKSEHCKLPSIAQQLVLHVFFFFFVLSACPDNGNAKKEPFSQLLEGNSTFVWTFLELEVEGKEKFSKLWRQC